MDEVLSVTLSGGDLRCAICHEVYWLPVHTPCSHCFCRPCLVRWMRQGGSSCPDCRTPFPTLFDVSYVSRLQPDHFVTQIVSKHFYQPCQHGCGHHLHPAEVDSHHGDCVAALIPCENADRGCTELVRRDDMLQHLKTCPHFVCCGSVFGCDYKNNAAAVAQHHLRCRWNMVKDYIDKGLQNIRPPANRSLQGMPSSMFHQSVMLPIPTDTSSIMSLNPRHINSLESLASHVTEILNRREN
jgi:hypothetical protein